MISLSKRTIDCLTPADPVPTWEWLRTHFHDKDGRPFNSHDYPWTKKICESWDDPSVNTIWLQFAARLGKSLIAQACLIKSMVTDPCPMMLASANKDLIEDAIKNKMWPALGNCGRIAREIMPPPHKQHQRRMDLLTCRVYSGWSGSPATLGDKDPRLKWAYEIDKFTTDVSSEADPLKLFRERGIENIDMCEILESTPTIKGHSRVNAGVLGSTNERFLVPCPLCGEFLQLIRGEKATLEKTGGLIWNKIQGEKDASAAAKTARYLCVHCHGEWKDEHRRPAIRKGVWCPEGCRVEKDGQLIGNPVYEGPERGFQLGRLYAPQFGFDRHARAWVDSHDDPQNHINSWDGEVHELLRSMQTWETLGQRWSVPDHKQSAVPMECSFLSQGIDVQADHFVFWLASYGSDRKSFLVHWGTVQTWEEVDLLIDGDYPVEGSDRRMHVGITLMDCRDGARKDEVIAYCQSKNRSGRHVFPCMGTQSGHMSGKPWIEEQLDKSYRIAKGNAKRASIIHNFYLIKVNTTYWQDWIQRCIDVRTPGSPNSIGIPASAAADQDMLKQILNEGQDIQMDSSGHPKVIYVVIDENRPWDFRDAARYSRCGAEVFTQGNWARVPEMPSWIPRPAVESEPRRAEVATEKNEEEYLSSLENREAENARSKKRWMDRGKRGRVRRRGFRRR